jgi:hypothetical protein
MILSYDANPGRMEFSEGTAALTSRSKPLSVIAERSRAVSSWSSHEEVSGAVVPPELQKKLNDRRLHRNIERRRNLVADDDVRFGCEGPGDATRCFSPPDN